MPAKLAATKASEFLNMSSAYHCLNGWKLVWWRQFQKVSRASGLKGKKFLQNETRSFANSTAAVFQKVQTQTRFAPAPFIWEPKLASLAGRRGAGMNCIASVPRLDTEDTDV